MSVTVICNRPAFDQFHHEVGCAIVGRAAIEQPGDIGMLETRHDLALVPKTADDNTGMITGAHDLDGHFLAILIVGAAGAIDFPHASRAQLREDSVRTYLAADPSAFALPQNCRCGCGNRGAVEEFRIRRLLVGNQALDLPAKRNIAGAASLQISLPLARIDLKNRGENRLDLLPSLRRHVSFHVWAHVWAPRSMACCNQSRAVAHSRFVVAGEISTTRAVSAMERPPKNRSSTICDCRASREASCVIALSRLIRSRFVPSAPTASSSSCRVKVPPPRF